MPPDQEDFRVSCRPSRQAIQSNTSASLHARSWDRERATDVIAMTLEIGTASPDATQVVTAVHESDEDPTTNAATGQRSAAGQDNQSSDGHEGC